MASIVSSQIIQDNIQIDGRHAVSELWIDDLGNQYQYDYMADPGTDINQKLLDRQDQVLQDAITYQAGS